MSTPPPPGTDLVPAPAFNLKSKRKGKRKPVPRTNVSLTVEQLNEIKEFVSVPQPLAVIPPPSPPPPIREAIRAFKWYEIVWASILNSWNHDYLFGHPPAIATMNAMMLYMFWPLDLLCTNDSKTGKIVLFFKRLFFMTSYIGNAEYILPDVPVDIWIVLFAVLCGWISMYEITKDRWKAKVVALLFLCCIFKINMMVSAEVKITLTSILTMTRFIGRPTGYDFHRESLKSVMGMSTFILSVTGVIVTGMNAGTYGLGDKMVGTIIATNWVSARYLNEVEATRDWLGLKIIRYVFYYLAVYNVMLILFNWVVFPMMVRHSLGTLEYAGYLGLDKVLSHIRQNSKPT